MSTYDDVDNNDDANNRNGNGDEEESIRVGDDGKKVWCGIGVYKVWYWRSGTQDCELWFRPPCLAGLLQYSSANLFGCCSY